MAKIIIKAIKWIALGIVIYVSTIVLWMTFEPPLKKFRAKKVVKKLKKYEEENGHFPENLSEIGESDYSFTYVAIGDSSKDFVLEYYFGLFGLGGYSNKWMNGTAIKFPSMCSTEIQQFPLWGFFFALQKNFIYLKTVLNNIK